MAQITAASVKQLRDTSLAGMADCKKALEETGGDMEKAAEWLRKKGITKAGQAQSRVATEGAVSSYIHMGGKIGVLIEVNCQTDFVARTDDFKAFCKDVAMHIAGRDPFPMFVSDEEIPAEVVEKDAARGSPREVPRQAREHHRQDRRRPDREVEEGHLLARSRVRQGSTEGHSHADARAVGADR